MLRMRSLTFLAAAVVLAMLSACGAQTAATPTATAVVLLASGSGPTPTIVPTPAPIPTSTPAVELAQVGSKSLFILHTNDVIGYTDPCG